MPFDGTDTRTDAELLRIAKAYIDHPSKWCQGAFESTSGIRHCAMSALNYAVCGRPIEWVGGVGYAYSDRLQELDDQIRRAAGTYSNTCHVNNTVEHPELMAIFDKAIATAEGGNHAV